MVVAHSLFGDVRTLGVLSLFVEGVAACALLPFLGFLVSSVGVTAFYGLRWALRNGPVRT